MQAHVVKLTKQRLSDFFVKEDGHVAHKNALVAGTVASGAILATLMLTPDATVLPIPCGDIYCIPLSDVCHSGLNDDSDWMYWCTC